MPRHAPNSQLDADRDIREAIELLHNMSEADLLLAQLLIEEARQARTADTSPLVSQQLDSTIRQARLTCS